MVHTRLLWVHVLYNSSRNMLLSFCYNHSFVTVQWNDN